MRTEQPAPGPDGRVPVNPPTAGSIAVADVGPARRDGLDASPSATEGKFRFRPMDDSTSAENADLNSERRRELLAAARRAYWNHDIPLAIQHYQALAQAYPNDPDVFGEMGNIYYEQGEYEQAGRAYYEAGLLLLRRGQHTRARELAGLIEKTAPKYAQDLLERLQGTR